MTKYEDLLKGVASEDRESVDSAYKSILIAIKEEIRKHGDQPEYLIGIDINEPGVQGAIEFFEDYEFSQSANGLTAKRK